MEVNNGLDDMGKYLTFMINHENYGIDIKDIMEIVGMQKITKLPEQPNYLKGIINLRGKIIPVVDIRIRFKQEEISYDDRTCIMILKIQNIFIGYIVDRVLEVVDVKKQDISKPLSFNEDVRNRYILGITKINDNIVILINGNDLLTRDELELTSLL